MTSEVRVNDGTNSKIDALVASGRFASREAVVEAAVDCVAAGDPWLRMVDEKVAEGRADFEAGRVYTADEVRGDLRDRYRSWPA